MVKNLTLVCLLLIGAVGAFLYTRSGGHTSTRPANRAAPASDRRATDSVRDGARARGEGGERPGAAAGERAAGPAGGERAAGPAADEEMVNGIPVRDNPNWIPPGVKPPPFAPGTVMNIDDAPPEVKAELLKVTPEPGSGKGPGTGGGQRNGTGPRNGRGKAGPAPLPQP